MLNERRSAEQRRLGRCRDRCLADRDNQARRTGECEAKWAEYLDTNPEKAEIVLPMVNKEIEKLAAAETRLQAAETRSPRCPPKPRSMPCSTLPGLTDAAGDSMAAVNAKLAREFESFIVGGREDPDQAAAPLARPGCSRSGSVGASCPRG